MMCAEKICGEWIFVDRVCVTTGAVCAERVCVEWICVEDMCVLRGYVCVCVPGDNMSLGHPRGVSIGDHAHLEPHLG